MLDSSHSPPVPGESAPPRILQKFAYLLSALWVREALQAVFLVYLARVSSTTYGEFILALGLGSILLLVAEFGLNLPLVSLLAQKDGDPDAALTQVSLLKGTLLILALMGVVGFMEWQDYAPSLKHVMFMLCAGLGLEALSNSFFVALQVQGRQDLQGKIKALAAGIGFGYGLIALALGAAPLVVAAFKLIESLINLGFSFNLMRSRGRFRFKWPSMGRLGSTLRLGLVFALIEVSAVIYNKANLFFLQKYAGVQGVAQYSVTWQTVDGISVLVSNLLLQSILFPIFVQLWEVDRGRVSQLAQNTPPLAAGRRHGGHVSAVHRERPHHHPGLRSQLPGSHLAAKVPGGDRGLCLYAQPGGVSHDQHAAPAVAPAFLPGRTGLQPGLVRPGHSPGAPPGGGPGHSAHQGRGGPPGRVFLSAASVGLILRRPLLQLGLTVLAGALLYLMGHGRLPREATEALALAPTLLLTWRWWRKREELP